MPLTYSIRRFTIALMALFSFGAGSGNRDNYFSRSDF
jgi:hypothetical protein